MRLRLATFLLAHLFGLAHAASAAVVTASPKTRLLGNVTVMVPSVGTYTLSSDTNNLSITIVKDGVNCANGAGMEVTNPPGFPASIQSSNPLPVEVTFTPQSRGTRSCQFDVIDQAGTTLLETFSATGTGVAPVLAVSEPALSYGNVRLSETKDLSFTIGNSTTDIGQGLMINSITLGGSSPAQYVFLAKPPNLSVLEPGTEQTVTVGFKPTSSGTKPALVNINTNDPITPTYSVTLSGTGTIAIINLPPEALIPDVAAGSSGSTDVPIGNIGFGATLSITSGNLTASGDWITFAGEPPGVGCAGSKTCTFDSILEIAASSADVTVQCTPPLGASGWQSETLTFASDTYPGTDKQTTVTCTVDDVIFADAFEGP